MKSICESMELKPFSIMNRSDAASQKGSPDSCEATEAALAWVDREGLSDSVIAGVKHRRRRRHRRITVGATAAAALLIVAGVVRYQSPADVVMPAAIPASVVMIASSEMKLPDGSIVQLRNDAELIPAYTAESRTVILLKGTAYFKVTKDPSRPFIVLAGQVGVRAVGTAFSVEIAFGKIDVLVTEGRVAVSADANSPESGQIGMAPALVSGGEYVSVNSSVSGGSLGPLLVQPITDEFMADRLSWRIPRLEFSGTPLVDVVLMFNRHNRQQLILGDAALADLKLSGLLRANNIQALLSLLSNQFQIQADFEGPDQIVLRSRM